MSDSATGSVTVTATDDIQAALALAADTRSADLRPMNSHGSIIDDVLAAVGLDSDGPYREDGTLVWYGWYDSRWHRGIEEALRWLAAHGAGIDAKFRGGESGSAWTYTAQLGGTSLDDTYLVELPHTELDQIRAASDAVATLRETVMTAPDGATWTAADILALLPPLPDQPTAAGV